MGAKSAQSREPAETNREASHVLRDHAASRCVPPHSREPAAALIKLLILVLLGCAAYAPRAAYAQSGCESCEVSVGAGGTYHYWGTTGSLVLPVTVTWSENRYEFGVFRFTDQQLLPFPGTHRERQMANPYWGASLSRRWQIFERGPVRGYFGFGLAGRTEWDELSTTRWDFASQLGLRFPLPGERVIGEVTMRHWSNGGIKLPNHGQDFATLTIRLNSGIFRLGQENRYAIDPSFNLQRSPVGEDPDWERTALP
jgi:lipid A 3-O-deacylase PagL